jgi:hypothetical protein
LLQAGKPVQRSGSLFTFDFLLKFGLGQA